MRPLGRLLALVGLFAACGGARSAIKADTSRYVISLSDGLRNDDGSLVTAEQVAVVGHIDLSYTDWSALWMFVPYRHTHDISDDVNGAVEKSGGNAVVHLMVKTSHCDWNSWTVVGLLPDCAHVDVHGTILKVSPRGQP